VIDKGHTHPDQELLLCVNCHRVFVQKLQKLDRPQREEDELMAEKLGAVAVADALAARKAEASAGACALAAPSRDAARHKRAARKGSCA
jgi:hypothetical protein